MAIIQLVVRGLGGAALLGGQVLAGGVQRVQVQVPPVELLPAEGHRRRRVQLALQRRLVLKFDVGVFHVIFPGFSKF